MADQPTVAPALSTPAEHLFEHVSDEARVDTGQESHATNHDLAVVYEVARTAQELHDGGRRRIALQFPDHMLPDAPAVAALLEDALAVLCDGGDAVVKSDKPEAAASSQSDPNPHVAVAKVSESSSQAATDVQGSSSKVTKTTSTGLQKQRIYILADTSYSACCVDEIAAEHVDADVVVHYGRSCLSPTSRLPVIHVFTKHRLDRQAVISEFVREFPAMDSRVVLMADVAYQDHVDSVASDLSARGYTNVLTTSAIHLPFGKLPNRTARNSSGDSVEFEGPSAADLTEYDIFHISTPPTSLLLALSSRVKSLRIFPTAAPNASSSSHLSDAPSVAQFSRRLLGRRYAKLLTLSTAGIIGILVNTLSVSNYLSSLDAIRKQIAAAGKKSYTVVVGKLNPAKLANFAEIDGWVVVGCWESSLVEDDASFYRPAITPFELEVALMKDEERVWGDKWWGGIEAIKAPQEGVDTSAGKEKSATGPDGLASPDAEDDDDESEPPEFDLRTGKLVSRSRPMRGQRVANTSTGDDATFRAPVSGQLAVRQKAEVATINGVVSPGAEFLRSQRTWTGLGSDFDTEERSTVVEEGRSGVARGYTVGSDADRS
ncbi:diphthamide biosynthesis protein 2 [Pyricularia oryzae 70-15]|uniref:2-(3-amino-3-carboxypropyl)histidine synthase subunit 2 n=1 Tax=Pyricularia oryzae (strain 70-15 / ATCC MYA-4617 / FGSC 8958) TaxID=242507 RepID=G4MYQ5_PYRO7|nr:diphthamide biosynthesis protein 2 [Pyricularia oryzae 70-15]EHA55284.1 diphthamide biosynthesis protein 2 [Pyricularia oryzae 70-15]